MRRCGRLGGGGQPPNRCCLSAAAYHCATTTSRLAVVHDGDVEGPASCRCGAVITSIRLISRGPTSNGMVPGYGLLAIVHDGDDKAVRSMIS
jgi:hypothetical protein